MAEVLGSHKGVTAQRYHRYLLPNAVNHHRYNLFVNLGGSQKTQSQKSQPTKVDLGLSRTYRREKTVFYVRTHGEWKVVSSSWTLGRGGRCKTVSFYLKLTKDDCSISVGMIGGLQG